MGGRRYMVKGKKNHTMVPTAYAELVYPSCPPVVQCCFDKKCKPTCPNLSFCSVVGKTRTELGSLSIVLKTWGTFSWALLHCYS